MGMLGTMAQTLRRKWKLAVASCGLFALASIVIILMVIHPVPPFRSDSTTTQRTSASPAPGIETSVEPADRIAIEAAQQKRSERRRDQLIQLASDQQQRQKLDGDRQRILAVIAAAKNKQATPSEEAGEASDPASLREHLASALVHLIMLEKQYPNDHPDVVAVRAEITHVQAVIAKGGPDPRPAVRHPVEPAPDYTPQLLSVNTAIEAIDSKIAAEAQQLASLQIPEPGAPIAVPSRHLPTDAFHITFPPRTVIRPVLDAAFVSLLFGALFAALIVSVSIWREESIRDEVALRRLLPTGTAYIGTIPKMRQ